MRKLSMVTIITLAVGLTMAVIGAIFQDITWTGNFNPVNLAGVLETIGYITAAFSGIVLVALGVSSAVKSESK